jgi:hypothetical protein
MPAIHEPITQAVGQAAGVPALGLGIILLSLILAINATAQFVRSTTRRLAAI